MPALKTTTPHDHVTTVGQMMADDWETVVTNANETILKGHNMTVKVSPLEVCVALGLLNPEVLKIA